MDRPPHGGVAKPPVAGSRVFLDGKAATVQRVYGELVAVVYDNEATVAMVPLSSCNKEGLNAIGRKVRTVIRRETLAAATSARLERQYRAAVQIHCVRRPQARGTARRRVAVRRTCGATRAGPSRSTDGESEPDLVAASLAGGAR